MHHRPGAMADRSVEIAGRGEIGGSSIASNAGAEAGPIVRPTLRDASRVEHRRAIVAAARFSRVGITVAVIVVTETLVCALAAAPVVAGWALVLPLVGDATPLRLATIALLAAPSYAIFALLLMGSSAAATWLTCSRTAPGLELRIRDMSWPLMRWVRYMVSTHMVRVFAGSLFRGSPFWTMYLRLNGARIGRGVYVNTLAIADHNLLDFGDGVVIGERVHLSGHTVEGGIVKTGSVTLGAGTTVGVGAILSIDVEAGAGCQIGALSFVPKRARLDGHAVYVGIPARRLR